MNSFSNLTLAVFGLGTTEMLLILAVVVLLFGAKKLPELAKGMGKSIKEFKKASNENDEEDVDGSAKKPDPKQGTTKTPDSH